MVIEKDPLIAIYLTEEQAKLFVEFQRINKNIELLVNSKAFDIKNGCFVTHLDGNGNITKLERHDNLFDRRSV